MSFEIYFDESHKIDKKTSIFSYYGIIGWDYTDRKAIDEYKRKSNLKAELHFANFSLNLINYYIDIFKYALNSANVNVYIVNTQSAFNLCNKLDITEKTLRKLFYIKIPERLIYGMTRHFSEYKDINIFIDRSNEYGNYNYSFLNEEAKKKIRSIICNRKFSCEKKIREIDSITQKIYDHIQLVKTLKEQLNSQSAYRNLNYKVIQVKQIDSKESVSLQISDIILGFLGYLFEEKYIELPDYISGYKLDSAIQSIPLTEEEKNLLLSSYEYNNTNKYYKLIVPEDNLTTLNRLKFLNKKLKIYSNSNIEKAEFVYRLLKDDDTLNKIHKMNIFMWDSDEDINFNNRPCCIIEKPFVATSISKFLNFKYDFDINNMLKIINFHSDSLETSLYSFNEYREHLEYPNRLNKMLERYLLQLNIKCKEF